jgi:hypothetical protein
MNTHTSGASRWRVIRAHTTDLAIVRAKTSSYSFKSARRGLSLLGAGSALPVLQDGSLRAPPVDRSTKKDSESGPLIR